MSEQTTLDSAPHFLSFGDAARLTGLPKEYLRELAEAGQLAVHNVRSGADVKPRVTRACLTEAGLLARAEAPVFPELSELIALVREQSERIAHLEEQRFQLGAQLGAAIERVAAIEARTDTDEPQSDTVLAADRVVTSEPEATDVATDQVLSESPAATDRGVDVSLARRLGARGAARAGRLTEHMRPLRGRLGLRHSR